MDAESKIAIISIVYGLAIGGALLITNSPAYIAMAFCLMGYTLSFWGAVINMNIKKIKV